MPITTSAKKALRQSVRRRARNIKRKNAYKAAVKAVAALLASGKKDEAGRALSALYKAADKAAKGRAIQKNTARRIKSRFAKLAYAK